MNHDLCAAALWRSQVNIEALIAETQMLRAEIEKMKQGAQPGPLRVVGREEKEDGPAS